jgi:hypothetical protein
MTKENRNQAKGALMDLAEKALTAKYLNGRYSSNLNPGEIIQNLGPVKRQILKDLKSEDISDIRWPK